MNMDRAINLVSMKKAYLETANLNMSEYCLMVLSSFYISSTVASVKLNTTNLENLIMFVLGSACCSSSRHLNGVP